MEPCDKEIVKWLAKEAVESGFYFSAYTLGWSGKTVE